MKNKDLVPRQKMFCAEYLIDKNGTQAAIRAGYSKSTAAEQSSRLLRNVKIKEEIESGLANHAKICAVTRESILEDYRADQKRARQLDQIGVSTQINANIAKMFGLEGTSQIDITTDKQPLLMWGKVIDGAVDN